MKGKSCLARQRWCGRRLTSRGCGEGGATSLRHLDLWVRRGLPISILLPHVGGSDVAGTVVAAGVGVEGVVPGTRVVVDPSLHYEWYRTPRAGAGLPDARFQVVGEHVCGGHGGVGLGVAGQPPQSS